MSGKLLLVAAILVGSAQGAGAVVFCAHPRADGSFNTTVKIRTTCHRGERQLDASALSLPGPRDVAQGGGVAFTVYGSTKCPEGSAVQYAGNTYAWGYAAATQAGVTGAPTIFSAGIAQSDACRASPPSSFPVFVGVPQLNALASTTGRCVVCR